MRVYSFFIVCILLTLPSTLPATVIAPMPKTTVLLSPETQQKLASLKTKEIQKIIGRKLTFKEKVSLFILRHTGVKKAQNKQGNTALIFAICGLALLILGLFLPYVLLGSLVAAIVAVVLGSVAKKQDPSDKKARAGALLGWITLGAIALLLILVAIALTTIV